MVLWREGSDSHTGTVHLIASGSPTVLVRPDRLGLRVLPLPVVAVLRSRLRKVEG